MPKIGRKIQFKHDLSHDLEPSGVPSGKSCCSDDLGGCIIFVVEVRKENVQDRRQSAI